MNNQLWPIPILLAILAGTSVGAGPHEEEDSSGTPPKPGVVPFDTDAARRLQDAWARHLSVDRTVKNSVGLELILVPPGKFRTGREDVAVAGAFYLGRTEVTRAQWTAVMGTTPWKDQAQKGNNRPATFVSWDDATAFCERLTAREKNGTYRLPTEAEWEFACRAGTATRFGFGNDDSKLGEFAWTADNTRKAGEPYAHDVGLKKPNAFGLFDTHGNVWEYCAGEYGSDTGKEERPRPVKGGPLRVAAGGSWDADLSRAYRGNGPAFYCRSDSRTWPVPGHGNAATGLRVAWSPPAGMK